MGKGAIKAERTGKFRNVKGFGGDPVRSEEVHIILEPRVGRKIKNKALLVDKIAVTPAWYASHHLTQHGANTMQEKRPVLGGRVELLLSI